MDDLAGFLDGLCAAERLRLASHAFQHGRKRLLHVLCLFDLVLTPLPVEAQHRDAPLIHHVGIKLAVAVLVWQHFATSCKAELRTVETARILLELATIHAGRSRVQVAKAFHLRHLPPAAHLNVITTGKAELGVLIHQPPRYISVQSSRAIFVHWRQVLHGGNVRPQASADAVHEIAPHLPRGIRQPRFVA